MVHFIWKQFVRLRNPSCTINTSLVGRNVKLGRRIHVGHGALLAADSVGDYTYISNYCLIDKSVKSIGKYCSIAYNCRIGSGSHPTNWVSTHRFAYAKKYGFRSDDIDYTDKNFDTYIGNDVWIGANVTILAGVKIGNGAIIGAHSLVTKDVEPYSVVIGTPARHLKFRIPSEQIEKFQRLEWWNWSDQKIKENIHLFSDPEEFLKEFDEEQ